jgi:glycosyltransferase involved in cell wall biosynthesis
MDRESRAPTRLEQAAQTSTVGVRVKVVLLTADVPPHPWSGIGVAVARQAADLAALGVHVTMAVAGAATTIPAGGEYEVVRIGHDGALPSALDGASCVHLHSLALAEIAVAMRRRFGARLVSTVHTQPWLELPCDPRRRFWLDVQTRVLAACDRVVFLSDAERTAAEALFPRLPAVHVVPHGVPPPPADVPGFGARRHVIFAGRCTRSKGVDLLADCIRRVRLRRNVRFLVATGHGDAGGAAAIARIARDHGDSCEITGWLSRDAIDARLAQALLALVPSRYEPFGLIALEAMRMGTPVVAANVGGLRETAGAGGGVVLDTSDAQVWADVILRVTEDVDAWTMMQQRALETVRTRYRSTTVAERLLREVYQ